MTIEEKDFKLTPVSEDSLLFDLELLYKVKPRGKEARLEFKPVAYGITMDKAIRKIVAFRINCKHQEEALKLKEWYSEYKKELDSFKLCMESVN